MTKCSATTKTGKPCPVDARPSGLCHVHDPAVQCGVPTWSGRQCQVPTGGGRCKTHVDPLAEGAKVLAAAQRAVADAVAAGVDRGRLTGIVGSALSAMRTEVWPDAVA
ncbi:hypothetical protein ABH920_009244 [Catenulispora sp. EB89]|uniref:hypothetical protein n=1 Tax=Catenulispora sp. EB89 TaxID=3156257 RepID=UPI00351949DF